MIIIDNCIIFSEYLEVLIFLFYIIIFGCKVHHFNVIIVLSYQTNGKRDFAYDIIQ